MPESNGGGVRYGPGDEVEVKVGGSKVKVAVHAVKDGKVYGARMSDGKRVVFPLPASWLPAEAVAAPPQGLGESLGLAGLIGTHKQFRKPDEKAPHVMVKARAGTGKTFALAVGVAHMYRGRFPDVWRACVEALRFEPTPSEQQAAVWESMALSCDAQTVRFGAFNKGVVKAFEEQYRWLIESLASHGVRLEFSTMHSMGYAAIRKAVGAAALRDSLVADLCSQQMGYEDRAHLMTGRRKDQSPHEHVKVTDQMLADREVMRAVEKLVGYAKVNLLVADAEDEQERAFVHGQFAELAERYGVDIDDNKAARVFDLSANVLAACRNPAGNGWVIDFDDMISLPAYMALPIDRADLFLGDESQDWNPAQQQLARSAGDRVVFVGDPAQSIYGFAGADTASMANCKAFLEKTPRGCVELPLTVTRRCARAVVAEAKEYVPDFEAHESNAEGRVLRMRYFRQRIGGHPGAGYTELPLDETFLPHVRPSDMVVCALNGPAVSTALRLIRMGVPAYVMGRDIGKNLADLHARIVKGMTKRTAQELAEAGPMAQLFLGDYVAALSTWYAGEVWNENAKRTPSESKLRSLEDRYACLHAVAQTCVNANHVAARLAELFSDDANPAGRVRLSSIHKAKGLEATRVFYLRPPEAQLRASDREWENEQRRNLAYVAVTRAIHTLVYVE